MSEVKRLLFIYNPHAGKGLVKANLSGIIEAFSASDYEVIVHATKEQGDAKRIAEEYTLEGTVDRIVCAGGDGTLDEVADGVMSGKEAGGKKDISVGIISAGSANDFGYSLGIPSNLIEAAKKAVTGREFFCDIARFNGRHFTYTAAFGMLAEISFETPQETKNALGYAAYILDGMTKLHEVKKIHAKVTFDGETIEDDYLIGMVVSSTSIGGIRGITGEGVRLDDGLHELMLIRAPRKMGDLSKAINEVLSHKYNGTYLKYYRVKDVSFEFDREIAWSLDGENGGLWKEAHIEVMKQGITYIV